MPIDLKPGDALVDALVADLAPVRARRPEREIALVTGAVLMEAIAVLWVVGMRADMPVAMTTPAFWWKALVLGLVAGIGGAAALLSLDPAITTATRLRRLAVALAVALPLALVAGWLLDAAGHGSAALAARLDWRSGIHCVGHVIATALPLLALLAAIIRRGAPTRPAQTAAIAGLASAGLGACGFVLSCPHDDPLYVAVWYGLAVAIMAGLARLLLPRLIRW